MSDNELDNLFKEAAEGFTPPQDDAAWKQMAAMLDKNPVKPADFWNWKTISALTATGLITLTAIWYSVNDQQKQVNLIVPHQASGDKSIEKNEANNATQGVVHEQREQPQPAGKQDLAPAKSLEDEVGRVRAVKGIVQNQKKRKAPTEQLPGEQSLRGSGNVTMAEVSTSSEVQSAPEESLSNLNDKTSLIAMKQQGESVLSADSIKPVAEQTAADSVEMNRDSTKVVTKAVSKNKGALSLKAVVSPDFSSVNYFSAGKTGINYGLLIGYAFTNRWSVYTGVISSKKLYDTREVEGSYSWDGHDYPVKELDGDCRILDIPINVYYTFYPERSFSVRAGLGFSSYIMRKESYVFCVDNYGNDAYYKQQIIGENNEWFKVMNLSVAVSKKLSGRLSAEFEPFVKAPLAGVGEGKVSLVSMGAFINVKYDLVIFK